GVIVGEQNLGTLSPRTGYDLYLGRRPFGADAFSYLGLLDEASLYNRALTASEIQSIYNADSAGKCRPDGVAPSIASQPQSETVTAGANVTFSLVANGTPPLSYEWRYNSASIIG